MPLTRSAPALIAKVLPGDSASAFSILPEQYFAAVFPDFEPNSAGAEALARKSSASLTEIFEKYPLRLIS